MCKGDDHSARVYGAVCRERARADARGQPRARALGEGWSGVAAGDNYYGDGIEHDEEDGYGDADEDGDGGKNKGMVTELKAKMEIETTCIMQNEAIFIKNRCRCGYKINVEVDVHARARVREHVRVCARVHVRALVRARLRARMRTRARVRACVRLCVCVCVRVCVRVRVRACKTCMQA